MISGNEQALVAFYSKTASELNLAPIILFAYKRPEHTLETLRALSANHHAAESTLIVYIDGPKENATQQDRAQIEKVAEIVHSQSWCREVQVVRSPVNKGLSRSVSEGVTEALNRYDKAIVLEDDIVTGEHFLEYMNHALSLYEHDERVACISGYIYPVKQPLPETFFLKGADCWGWATWKRAWNIDSARPEALLQQLEEQNKTSEFDFGDTYPYVQMLKDRIAGKNDSWAVLWYADAFLKNRLCLYPGCSLVHNIGNDGSGSHAQASDAWDNEHIGSDIKVKVIPLKEDAAAKKIVADYFTTLNPVVKTGFSRKIISKLRSLLKNN